MSLTDALCNCGEPIRYIHKTGASCNKYTVCPTYEALLDQIELCEKVAKYYQNSLNTIDDYFEYSNESLKDRKKVFQILETLTDNLKGIRQ